MRYLRFFALTLAFLAIGSVSQAQTSKTCSAVPCTGTVTVGWTPSTDAGPYTQDVFRETSAGACTITSTGSGPGCIKLNSAPLASTVTSFNDMLASTCTTASAACAPLGTYFYVVRVTRTSDGKASQGETNTVSITVSLPPPAPPTGQTAKIS